MKTLTFSGVLNIVSGVWDNFDTLILVQEDGYKQDLVSRLNEAVLNYGRRVAIRYWIAPFPVTKEEAQMGFLRTIMGDMTIDHETTNWAYSEYTAGTDYDTIMNVAGHNLYAELSREAYTKKYIILEVDFLKA